MVSLLTILGSVPDPRTGNAQRHALLDMLVIALAASVCGAESCVDFAEFAEDREVLLREFLSLENGLPSHDTFSRLFRLLDPQAFGRVFAAFLDDLGADGPGVLATSGKTLRRSFDRAAGRSPLHVVTGRRCTDRPRLPGLAMIACVQSDRQIGESVTTASRLYVSSARLTPEAFAKAVRAHWSIENSLHWVLDMSFDEDRARNRKDNGQENLSILRKLTLNILRKARPKLPVSRKRKRAGWSDDFAKSIIGQMR